MVALLLLLLLFVIMGWSCVVGCPSCVVAIRQF